MSNELVNKLKLFMSPVFKNGRLRASAISLIYEQSQFAYLAIFINSGAYVFLSWSIVPRSHLIAWMIAIDLVTVFRCFVQRRWRRHQGQLTAGLADTFVRRFKVGVVLSGALWGAMGGYLLDSSSGLHLALTTFILAGVTAGAVGAYVAFLEIVDLFLFISLAPFILRLFMEGRAEFLVMGLLASLYLILMATMSRNVNRRALRSIELGFENEDLVKKLNDASHEIRTPVTAIAGYAEFLRDQKESSPETKAFADVILRNSVFLKKLVENILLMSRTGTGEANNNRRDLVDIAAEISAAVSIVQAKLAEKNLKLVVNLDPNLPAQAYLDTLKFQQILINLLVNAIKFTERGQITVSASVNPEGRLAVRVADTGIGISESVRDKLFIPFYRESRLEVKSQEGSGLGLSLARTLAESLGGELRLIESELGKGSVFEFDVKIEWAAPESQLSAKTSAKESMDQLRGASILLVDDSEDMRILYKWRLEKAGATVQACATGHAAVSAVAQSKYFDVILMDIDMPDIDGYAALNLVRKNGFAGPVLALTAYSVPPKRASFEESGFDGHIGKSAELDQFIELVARWVKRKENGHVQFPLPS
jgi:signal transduction histidine kinase/ActR/RegA family two-component response regulator